MDDGFFSFSASSSGMTPLSRLPRMNSFSRKVGVPSSIESDISFGSHDIHQLTLSVEPRLSIRVNNDLVLVEPPVEALALARAVMSPGPVVPRPGILRRRRSSVVKAYEQRSGFDVLDSFRVRLGKRHDVSPRLLVSSRLHSRLRRLTSVQTSLSSAVKIPTPLPAFPLDFSLICLNASANCDADRPRVSTFQYRSLQSTTT